MMNFENFFWGKSKIVVIVVSQPAWVYLCKYQICFIESRSSQREMFFNRTALMEHFVKVTIYIDTKAACTMSKKIPLPLQRSFFVVLQNYEKRLKNPFGTIAIYVYLLLYVLILLKSTHDVFNIQTEFIWVSLVSKLTNESTIKSLR